MSGRDPEPNYPETPEPPSDCRITDSGSLASVNPAAITALKPGSILRVQEINPGSAPKLGAFDAATQVGRVVCRKELAILRCLAKGVLFEAEIQAINGGNITVVVRNA